MINNNYNGLIIPAEFWKDITENSVPGVLPYYQISNLGRVYSKYSNKILSSFQDNNGYVTVSLRTTQGLKTIRVHRVLMIEHHPIDGMENMDINHKNGEKNMNYDGNLEWATTQENIIHAYRNNLNMNIGETHANAKLDNATVETICQYLELGLSYNEIMEKLNMYDIYKNIYDIHHKINWNHISNNYNFVEYESCRDRFTDKQVHAICNMFQNNIYDYKTIIKELGYDISSIPPEEMIKIRTSISRIRKGANYKDISSMYSFNNERSDQSFTDEQVHIICRCLANGLNSRQIAEVLGVNPDNLSKNEWTNFKSTISAIKTRKNYKNISKIYKF